VDSIVNGSNFAKLSDFIFSEIVSYEEYERLKKNKPQLIVVQEYKYLKLHAIWYINPILKIKENDIIFCHTEVVEILLFYLNKLTFLKNLKLITHQSDRSLNKSIFDKKTTNISNWYSTNVVYENPLLHPIPIGVNNFYNENYFNKNIQNLFKKKQILNKNETIYVNFTVNTNNKHRSEAMKHVQLLNSEYTNIDMNHDTTKYIKGLSSSKYTLAPWGNGIDTHRFWEALYFGSTPITIKSIHYNAFKTLPVVLLDSFSELNFDNLEKNYKSFTPDEIDELDINYWINFIRSEEINASDTLVIDDVKLIKIKIFIFKIKIRILSLIKKFKYYLKRYLNIRNYIAYFSDYKRI
jgi:hypothetical protein